MRAALGRPLEEIWPDDDIQVMHYDLFPHEIIHIENAGGQIDRVLDQRVTVGCFPWRFMGGEAAFCRFVAFCLAVQLMADSFVATVRRNAYVDSISLLQVSAELLSLAGVLDAALVMATDLNRQVLHDAGLLVDDAQTAGPNDLVIAVRATDDASPTRPFSRRRGCWPIDAGHPATPTAPCAKKPRSLRSAHRADPEANLAVISVPGPFAANEARQALADGLHVFLFSDNVSVEDEVDLKRVAASQNLLVMGPDCGTSILNGVGLGFANVVRRGRIGLVGASGTGLQEVTSLLHQAGEGISHAIGTGGRDLHAAVGGITTLQALDLLRDDPGPKSSSSSRSHPRRWSPSASCSALR